MFISLSLPQRQDLVTLISMAEKAETFGYHGIWLGDHYFNRSVFISLGLLARSTERIFLGTGVTNPFHITPAMLASFGATLQEISRGRFRMGLGAGDTDSLRIEGIIRPPDLPVFMEQTVKSIQKLATGQEAFFPVAGKDQNAAARLNYSTVETCFPVYLGVLGPTMMKTAVKCSDGMLINSSSVQDVLRAVTIFERALNDGLSAEKFQIIPFTLVEVLEKKEKESNFLKGMISKIVSDLPASYVLDREDEALVIEKIRKLVKQQNYAEAFKLLDHRLINNFSITGSFDEITQRLLEFEKIKEVKEIIIGGTGIPGKFEKFMATLREHLSDHLLV
ncbi:MAG: LLM class flavin-dependent oxidoreductase [Candidatus Odinarchaeota archaeon]